MYICLLKKPTKFYHATIHFAVFLISLQIFTNERETADRVYVTKSTV